MTEITLKGYTKRGSRDKVKRMTVHFMGENFVWFEFEMEDGNRVETLPLKGSV